MLLETVEPDLAELAASMADTVDPGRQFGKGAKWIGDPAASLCLLTKDDIEALLREYQAFVTGFSGLADVPHSFRDYVRIAQYMAAYVAITSESPKSPGESTLARIAAENAFLHVALPTMTPSSFTRAVKALSQGKDGLQQPLLLRARSVTCFGQGWIDLSRPYRQPLRRR